VAPSSEGVTSQQEGNMATYTFTMPSTREGPAGFDSLFYRYKLDRADSLIVTAAGVPTQKRTFEVSEITSAQAAGGYAYIGGHVYSITANEVSLLTTAGYGAYITVS